MGIILYPAQIGWRDEVSTIEIEIECPETLNGCSSKNVIKRGHDTKIKGHPQHYECPDCGRHFFPHTSGFYSRLESSINERLFSVLKDGKIDYTLLCEILGSSPSTISNLMRFIVEKVAKHPKTEIFWESPIDGEAIYIDETFIKIAKKTWYLIVFLSEKGNVLAFELVKQRKKDKILELFKKAEQRLGMEVKIFITDDFPTYKGVATGLGRNIIHVRHIHKPPHGRIVVDMIKHGQKEIVTRHYATTSDILIDTNTFIVQVSETVKKVHKKGKQGRPKGSKNRPKEVIEEEKRQKEKQKDQKKRGPKDPFKDAKTHVYHYDKDKGLFHPMYQSDKTFIECLRILLSLFENKHITTNPVENVFSVLKKLIDFRGKRDLEYWHLLLTYYFTVRECPSILKEVLVELSLSPQMLHKALHEIIVY
jgi:hypothetical protein